MELALKEGVKTNFKGLNLIMASMGFKHTKKFGERVYYPLRKKLLNKTDFVKCVYVIMHSFPP